MVEEVVEQNCWLNNLIYIELFVRQWAKWILFLPLLASLVGVETDLDDVPYQIQKELRKK